METKPAADPSGPHEAIVAANARERFALRLFDRLWDTYRKRVSYVATYEQVIKQAGARFVNDHIAFRTLACQQPTVGIHSLARIFDALGYRAAGCYEFPDKHLAATHFQHVNRHFPKIFISELKVWQLDATVRAAIQRTVANHRALVSEDVLVELYELDQHVEKATEPLLRILLDQFCTLPWQPPQRQDVEAVAQRSQYAAWVMVHGYSVNHFTSLINSHGVESLGDIEKTVDALRHAGVPMKTEVEGQPGSKLRQTATEAVEIDVDVLSDGRPAKMPWTYAYFELAERGDVTDPQTGQTARFEGFLGPQATQLFEMTRPKDL